MTRTFNDRAGPPAPAGTPRVTRTERAVVLGGFALAALCTAWSILAGAGIETVAAAWLAAGVWAFLSSLALALRRACAAATGAPSAVAIFPTAPSSSTGRPGAGAGWSWASPRTTSG